MSLKMQRFASWQLPRRRFVSSMALIMGATTLLWLRPPVSYPQPIVDLAASRLAARAAYVAMRSQVAA